MHDIWRGDTIVEKEAMKQRSNVQIIFESSYAPNTIKTLKKTVGVSKPFSQGGVDPGRRDSIAVLAQGAAHVALVLCTPLLFSRITKMAKWALDSIAATLRVEESTWLAHANMMALRANRWQCNGAQRRLWWLRQRWCILSREETWVRWHWQSVGELHTDWRRSVRQIERMLETKFICP
jgi:hypothetical protein